MVYKKVKDFLNRKEKDTGLPNYIAIPLMLIMCIGIPYAVYLIIS